MKWINLWINNLIISTPNCLQLGTTKVICNKNKIYQALNEKNMILNCLCPDAVGCAEGSLHESTSCKIMFLFTDLLILPFCPNCYSR